MMVSITTVVTDSAVFMFVTVAPMSKPRDWAVNMVSRMDSQFAKKGPAITEEEGGGQLMSGTLCECS